MKIVIIIPTVNEKKNINNTLEQTLEYVSKIQNHEFVLMVADSLSNDGTPGEVKKYSEKDKRVILWEEGARSGLGGAYIKAFKYAMAELKADAIMEFDADLQHNPKYIHKFVIALEEGYDVAVGTRFIKGGSIPKNWGIHRKFLSACGNLYARTMTGMYNLHDLSTGFRLTKTTALKKVNLDKLLSKRFAYKFDLYYRLFASGAKIREIPFKFDERFEGESKISFSMKINRNDFLESYIVVTKIFFERTQRFFKVFITGGFTGLLQLFVVYFLVNSFKIEKNISNILATEVSILLNFVINNMWSFQDRKIKSGVLSKLAQFHATSLGSIVVQIVNFFMLSLIIGDGFLNIFDLMRIPYYVIYSAIGIWLGLLVNFYFYSKVIWKKA